MASRKVSAGLLMYRRRRTGVEVLLVHPGGPLWTHRDLGAWTIPKGEIEPGEEPLAAAIREFTEETGFTVSGPYVPLQPITQRGGKVVHAFGVQGDADVSQLRSQHFQMEWPPRSGRRAEFPEADRAAWFALDDAKRRILAGQADLLDQLHALVEPEVTPGPSDES